MNEEHLHLLSVLEIGPARLTAEQVACVFNCQPYDIPVLVSSKLLKPLGEPLENCVKYFSKEEVIALARDAKWLNKMTSALRKHWQAKNARKRNAVTASKPASHD